MNRPQLHITGPDELPAPRIDDDSLAILNEAIDSLCKLRTPYWLGDSGARLHTLASLIAQADHLLADAVHEARDQQFNWAEIGQLLNLTAATAARRYRKRT